MVIGRIGDEVARRRLVSYRRCGVDTSRGTEKTAFSTNPGP